MRKYIMMTATAAAVATLAALSPAAAGATGQAARSGSGASARAQQAASGARLWASRFGGRGQDVARSVVVSRTRVFVTGFSYRKMTGDDYATVAYSAATGKQLWASRYNDPRNGNDSAAAEAVSRDGTRVFVTGTAYGKRTGADYATVAYSAATGRQLWISRYSGPGKRSDAAYSVAVSPNGTRVYVTGYSTGRTSGADFLTVAYNAATGRQLWLSRYNGPANGRDVAHSVAVNSSGSIVFATGSSDGRSTTGCSPSCAGRDYLTVAYNAATGRKLWVSRYHSSGNGAGNGWYSAWSMAVNAAGTRVFVTGSRGTAEYLTVAYDAATGKKLWISRYMAGETARSVTVSADGATVFVTGVYRVGAYGTVAYDAATGSQLWASRYAGPGADIGGASSVAVNPRGSIVFVTGSSYGVATSFDYATVAYDAANGSQLWASRYNGPGNGEDIANSVAVSPDGSRVFVTGTSPGKTTDSDYFTIAYNS